MTTVVETQRFTTADGAQLCYQLRGDEDAPKLLCVQGSMQDMRKTDAFLASLALRFRVLVYDHRGMGRSTMDVEPAHYSMAGYAADADALLQHLAWSRCHIMGVSFGGMVAQEIALRYPTRLGGPGGDAPGGGERGKERDDGGDPPCSLVLVCTSAGGEAGASAPLHEYARLSDYAFFSAFLRKVTRTRTQTRTLTQASPRRCRGGVASPRRWREALRYPSPRASSDGWRRFSLARSLPPFVRAPPPPSPRRRRMRLQLDFAAWASHPAAHATLLGTECLTQGTVGARAGGAWRAADALCSPVCVFVWLCRLRCTGHVSGQTRDSVEC